MNHVDFNVKVLGKATIKSPLRQAIRKDSPAFRFAEDGERTLYDVSLESFEKSKATGTEPVSFEKAGPRENIFFEPAKTKVGIVTCGGLCPGLTASSMSAISCVNPRRTTTRRAARSVRLAGNV